MKHTKRLAALALAGVLTAGLSGTALAAGDTGISVQLDGKPLTFTDAVPQARDGRTFLPLRAVFEALGAKVDYDAATGAVTAKRDGTTVTMTLGDTLVTVDRDGKFSMVMMDVAPFAENNRTYVPVRFAAQALDCAVGWDQDDQTVVLVDTGKLADEVLAGYQYTYLEKFEEYYRQFQEGSWAVKGSFDGSLTFLAQPIALEGTVNGLVKGGTQGQMDMNVKMDMLQFAKFMASTNQQALSKEEEAIYTALKKDGVGADVRMDLSAGELYVKYNDKTGLTAAAGMSSDLWYSMELYSLLAPSGVDLRELADTTTDLIDVKGMVTAGAANVILTDKDTAVADLTAAMKEAAASFADSAFVKSGNDYILKEESQDGDTSASIGLTLTMKNDKVVGWAMSGGVTGSMENASGTQSPITLSMDMGMDAKNHCTANVSANLAETLTMDLNMTMDYTKTTKTPETQPPAGAKVISYLELMAGQGLPAVAQADCPTGPAA